MRKWEKLRPVVFISAALALAWGLSLAGAVSPSTYYFLFLAYSVLTVLVLLTAPERDLGTWPWFPVYAVGVFLVLNVILRPPLLARGYVVLSLGWMAFVLTALLIGRDWRRARVLAFFLAIIGILEALYGLAYAITHLNTPHQMATGTFLNHNHYAGLLNLTLPFGFAAVLHYLSRRRRRRDRWEIYSKSWAVLLAACIVGLPIVLSVSRAGIVVFVICLTVGLVLLGRKRRESGTAAPGGAITLVVAVLVIVALSSGLALDSVLARFSELGPDSGFRLSIYRDTATILKSNLWTGIGPGMFEWRYRPVQTADERILVEHAHSDYLETAVEWGLPVAVVFWSLVVWLWFQSVRLFIATRRPWTEAMALGCVLALLSVLLHSLVDYNLQIPSNLMVFASILALAWCLTRRKSTEDPRSEGASS